MKFLKISWLSAATIAAAILFLTACEEGAESVGQEVLPPGDQLQTAFLDSLAMEFSSRKIDTLRTYRSARDIFGNYVDPQFGRMTATFFTEVNQPTSTSFIGIDPNEIVYDSIILKLSIVSAYGRPENTQRMRVYELADTIADDSDLGINSSIPTLDKDLANGFEFSVDPATGTADLSIRLDDELGRRLLFADSSVLNNGTEFRKFFSGLAISTDPVNFFSREPGSVFLLFSTSSATEIEVHYKQFDDGTQAFFENVASFNISDNTRRFFSYSRTEFDQTLVNTDFFQDSTADIYEFSQGVTLIQNFIRFPEIASLGEVAVNRGNLILSVIPDFLGSEERYAPPQDLEVYFADENGGIDLDDNGLFRPVFPTTVAYSSTLGGYELNLTDYFNDIILGKEVNNGLIIRPQLSNIFVNRAVLGGLKHPEFAPKVELFYVNFPD
ncbi:MAG: DUF4270 family protein [Bacteroidota bacterium]